MQRLFSTFPAGRPGAGLLLLRVSVGIIAALRGGLCLAGGTEARVGPWIGGLLAIATGLALIIGLFTPCAAAVAAVGGCAAAASSLSAAWLSASLVGVMAAAIVLLGPGAYSLDSRLFGRREIVIRARSRRPRP